MTTVAWEPTESDIQYVGLTVLWGIGQTLPLHATLQLAHFVSISPLSPLALYQRTVRWHSRTTLPLWTWHVLALGYPMLAFWFGPRMRTHLTLCTTRWVECRGHLLGAFIWSHCHHSYHSTTITEKSILLNKPATVASLMCFIALLHIRNLQFSAQQCSAYMCVVTMVVCQG